MHLISQNMLCVRTANHFHSSAALCWLVAQFAVTKSKSSWQEYCLEGPSPTIQTFTMIVMFDFFFKSKWNIFSSWICFLHPLLLLFECEDLHEGGKNRKQKNWEFFILVWTEHLCFIKTAQGEIARKSFFLNLPFEVLCITHPTFASHPCYLLMASW